MHRLRTLGGVALERDGAVLDAVGAQRKSLAFLTLLAASRDIGISRERVAAYLWPESDTEHARGALKQILHVVRRQLGSPEAVLGTSELRLNPSYVESDIDAFLGALDRRELELAVSLYRGPFLDGFHLPGSREFEEWASAQRDELARQHASALEHIASAAEERGDWDAAVGWLRRLATTDPFSTRTVLRLMRALDATGDRVAALRSAQVHQTLLREVLNSPPDAEVAVLTERLRSEVSQPVSPSETGQPDSAPLSTTAPAAPTSQRADEARHAGASRQRIYPGHITAAVAAAAALATVFLAAILLPSDRPQDPAGAMAAADRSVAVLPFENADGDLTIGHLTAAFTDELTVALHAAAGMRVAPSTMTLALHREGLDRNEIADSLRVAAVVEGTVRRTGDRIQVSVRLLSVDQQAVVWSDAYDHHMEDISAVQAEIARGVIGALHPGSTPSTAVRAGTTRVVDAEAYDLYLRGRHAWRQRTREGIGQAIVFFEGAIERDPSFAAAYAGLAATYVNCSNFAYCDVQEALARAEVAADRALALDAHLAEGHAAKGFVLASRLEFEASEAAFRRAVELNRGLTWAHHYYTLLLLMLGRTDEAIVQNGHALSVDPLSLPANATRGIILLQRGDITGAEQELQRALALSPGFNLTLYYLGVVRAAQGQYDHAGQLLEQAAVTSPEFTGMPGARAFVLRQTGRPHDADGLLAEVEADARAGNARALVNLATAHAALGRTDTAFVLLDRVEWDVPSLVELRADPLLRTLRADPRYPALIRKIGAGEQDKTTSHQTHP